ncbi:flagellar export chaperone FliS [Zoogloea sp.]|jgi:flagellar protein FliS|uniref:flagellar export chaperone FliS n=2 Tax=Zoogloea sp. TaxID=49181 RepID=UPI0011DA12DD|nr:flagellar export chaperone FliS [Zoogloea sp.]MBK6656137.1 flagellar export chaperone FliS [Zoogloea sp.]MBK7849121.1 flagellar export chaperone FliS [Zoogloea sp.]MBN8284772.1 flagellar export chaperone FliS [Zoogloea sp.]MBP7443781.1 flagellar export chaperone FliS [Zoogloea sp.]TXG94071.1 MAG: flagellar export chaperone FliS [Zoogloea sp.]
MSFGLATRRAASVYAEVGVETGVSTADPHKLILMLFEGALLQIGTAGIAMDNKDIPTKGTATSKAIEIITNGLKVSLDYEAGGELAERLGALYDYMTQRLLYANLNNSRPALDEVARLLNELKGAWEEIGTYDQANR